MKKFLIAALALLALGVTPGCEKPAPAPSSAAADAAVAAQQRAARQAMFGAEAGAPEVQWTDSGLGYRIVNVGQPPKPGVGAQVTITYTGRLKDGSVFDQTKEPEPFSIGGTIPGLSVGLQLLGRGGKATFYVPPSLGYGPRKVMGIPPNSGLIFDVDVVSVTQ
ncbi:MAG TPA: FKBP-type peptidyl-prolyl cis-trans isomerase [Opitutaceae bacterium]|nr:FKBP-type peptidyl-prolyl cis-trans isomerase [Opitutaceae bacterium]